MLVRLVILGARLWPGIPESDSRIWNYVPRSTARAYIPGVISFNECTEGQHVR